MLIIQFLSPAYRRRRGYNVPYTRGTGYRGSRKRLRSNTYNQQTEYRRRNVYNQQTGYQKGPKTNVYDQQTGYRQRYNQQTGYQKGPKTNVYDQYKPGNIANPIFENYRMQHPVV